MHVLLLFAPEPEVKHATAWFGQQFFDQAQEIGAYIKEQRVLPPLDQVMFASPKCCVGRRVGQACLCVSQLASG